MQYRLLGKSKIEISAILFGGWQAGKSGWTNISDDDTVAAHRAALEAGITTFDTAEAYGEGYSERILAKAIGDQRDQIVIATKVWAGNLKRDKVIEACERSLKNLGTDRIDLYQIHWPSGSFGSDVVPIEETMGALNTLKEQGKIRAIGVSNFSRAQIMEASEYGRVDSLQPPYSLFWRQVEAGRGALLRTKQDQHPRLLAAGPGPARRASSSAGTRSRRATTGPPTVCSRARPMSAP